MHACSVLECIGLFYVKAWLFTFFEMTYQNVVKSQQKFSHQSVKMSSYTSLSDHCSSIPSSRSVIHSEPLLNVNVYRNLASKFVDVMGTYRRLSHTVLGFIVSYDRISDQDVWWCWWLTDKPTFGNWVLQAERMIKWPVKLYVSFYVCFKIPKTWLFIFYVFELLHTFSRTLHAYRTQVFLNLLTAFGKIVRSANISVKELPHSLLFG